MLLWNVSSLGREGGGRGGPGLRCQYESRVCRIQISLQGLEARNHPELLDQRLFPKQTSDVYTILALLWMKVLLFYLCNQRGDGRMPVACVWNTWYLYVIWKTVMVFYLCSIKDFLHIVALKKTYSTFSRMRGERFHTRIHLLMQD